MIHYILQTVAFQLLFLGVYDLFLKRETFFTSNRLYLIVTPILSLLLPLVKIGLLRATIPAAYRVQLPAVLIGDVSTGTVNTATPAMDAATYSITEILQFSWFVGAALALGLFTFKLYKIVVLKRAGTKKHIAGHAFIELPKTDKAFTFINTIFLGDELSQNQQKNILLHEQVHVGERHFADLLFFEALRIVFWFNPLIYIYQSRAALLHEYRADAVIAKQQTKQEYYHNLLSQVFQVEQISFINTFFNHSLIKKRIIMLQKSKSKKIFQLKYLLLIPVIGGMLIYTSCSQETEIKESSSITEKIADLQAEIEGKEHLTVEEVEALNRLEAEANNKIEIIEVVETQEVDKNAEEVPFAMIDQVPVFPGCESMSNQEAKGCMSQKIQQFVGTNFNIKVADDLALSGKQRISVFFKINTNGTVQDVKARAAHPGLEAEAVRVVSSLPKMVPGEVAGKTVNVLYNLPIIFKVNE